MTLTATHELCDITVCKKVKISRRLVLFLNFDWSTDVPRVLIYYNRLFTVCITSLVCVCTVLDSLWFSGY